MSQHPEFAAEQEYLTWAYECLETMRNAARLLQYSIETGPGGTHQARFERVGTSGDHLFPGFEA